MSATTISRIARQVSQTVVEVLPPAAQPALSSTIGSAHVISLPHGDDPIATLLNVAKSSALVSLTASARAENLPKVLLPRAAELSQLPLVLHLEVQDNLTPYIPLQNAFPFFLISANVYEAHDATLIAASLARSLGIAVVHVFFSDGEAPASSDGPLELSETAVLDFISEKIELETEKDDKESLWRAYERAASRLSVFTSRLIHPLNTRDSKNGPEVTTVIFTVGRDLNPGLSPDGVRLVSAKLLVPLPPSSILSLVPSSTVRVIVLEQFQNWPMKWTPFYLEVVRALQLPGFEVQSGQLGSNPSLINNDDIKTLLSSTPSPSVRLQLGTFTSTLEPGSAPHIPKHESSYLDMLSSLFRNRLELSNSPSLASAHGGLATNPAFAVGRAQEQIERRAELTELVKVLLENSSVGNELHSLLAKWYLNRDDATMSYSCTREVVELLEKGSSQDPWVEQLLSLKSHLPCPSRWIIVSSAWSNDIGSSGLHHVLSSGLWVNLLILHTTPYSLRLANNPSRRQHDIGLYAMNYGSAYVASVAMYWSYAHTMQALAEADRFQGPSVILAYLPYQSENTPALDVLKETKLAVDAGYWPLYRWDPSKDVDGGEPFSLDSDSVKSELAQFLDRQNHLSQLVRSKPALAAEVVGSLGESLKEARRAKAQDAYKKLLHTIDAPPLTVLFASDGGGAEKLARRLATRGKMRGLETSVSPLDSMSLDTLKDHDGSVVFISATAGQGEPPQNGRKFFKLMNAAALSEDNSQLLSNVRYAVFGMGDSHYWPRAEDAIYFSKPGKDLDSKLTLLGAQRILDMGLGDAQASDGHEAQYKPWEAQLWKVLGVDAVEVLEREPEAITLEHTKAASNFLRGTIAEGLKDESTGALAPSDPPLTKYHGIWQQDDRDVREERQAQGVEPAYNFMVRARLTGGTCTPEQWLRLDRLADEHGNGTMKVTTRQTFQFHGILKKHLKRSVQDINKALLDTFEVGGDVNSNIVCSSIPTMSKVHAQVHQFCLDICDRLMPRTSAYHEIWLDKKMVAGHAVKDFEPVYGEFYLPRKFKIAIAVPPTNDVDVWTNDLGYIAIVDDISKQVVGYNVLVGGGMGTTLGNKKTYPRTASVIGFCTPKQAVDVAEKVTLVQRDFGDRVNRKTARVKYTVDRMGLDNFKAEVEKRLGCALQEPRPFTFDENLDNYGWSVGENGKHYFTMFIENGRIQDSLNQEFKTGLREIAKVHKGSFRLTTNQHVVISEINTEDLPTINDLLAKYNMNNQTHSGLRLASSACVGFPTCGLAMAESERYLPLLIDKVEKMLEDVGLRNDTIVMRLTGCPAGCTRPYVSEIGFLGKAPGAYVMLLGGGSFGQRLAKVYRENVTEPEILNILRPMFKRYALERNDGERFGDFVIRVGIVPAVTTSQDWM